MSEKPMKVRVIHSHEHGQGSTILAVVPDDPAGVRIERAIMAEAARGMDEVSVDTVEVTEPVLLPAALHAALRSLKNGTPIITPDGWMAVTSLVANGYVAVDSAPGGGIALRITLAGAGALAAHDVTEGR